MVKNGFEMDITIPIGGPVTRRRWSVRRLQRRYNHRKHKLLFRLSVGLFPCHDPVCPLRRAWDCPPSEHPRATTKSVLISVGDLLKFFSVLVLMTRFEFGKRHYHWKNSSSSKHIPSPAFGKTCMSRKGSTRILRAFLSAINQRPKGKLSLFGIAGC
jgi:hypothetical protein